VRIAGTRAKILGAGTVPLGCEIRQLAREIADYLQELRTVRSRTGARNRGR
jgi:hypothetical protein